LIEELQRKKEPIKHPTPAFDNLTDSPSVYTRYRIGLSYCLTPFIAKKY